ncbi:MAG: amidohydrolase [Thermoanaerobaculia bacterium]
MKKVLMIAPMMLAAAGMLAQAKTSPPALAPLEALMPDLEKLYLDLHQSPELSQHEEKTSAKMAERLKALGYQVTAGFGGYGVVGILENGKGPTVMIRTDLDALPVEEKTGVPYASRVRTKDDAGNDVGVMHACGHDTHMSSWVGTATLLARSKDKWRGTVMMVGQPDEEKDNGARAMLKAGLFTKFGKPDFAIAMHDAAEMPAGLVGVGSGYMLANSDSVDVTIYGRGGHGAYAYRTVDPIVIAARTVLALQTIVSREMNPLDPAVITVGSIHGGSKHNIIPDEVRLQLTVRSYKEDVRQKLLDAIARIAKAEAAAAGAPKEPAVKVLTGYASTYNDPALAKRLSETFRKAFGPDRVIDPPPVMASEDFSEYGRAGVPAVIMWVGAVQPEKYQAARASGTPLPGLHSSEWLPDYSGTIRTGVSSLTLAALELLARP